MSISKNNQGSSLIEVLVALSAATIIITTVLSLTIASHRLHDLSRQKTRAINMASDALEIAYYMRNENEENLKNLVSEANKYHPEEESGSWVLRADPETVEDYTRYVEINNVYRNEAGNISESGTNVDEDMVKVNAVVNWTSRDVVNTVELTTIMSNVK